MGLFEKLDRLANAGAKSQMPEEKRARAQGQSQSENARTGLADLAANPGNARVARKAARAQLVDALGGDAQAAAEADKRIKQANHKAVKSFR